MKPAGQLILYVSSMKSLQNLNWNTSPFSTWRMPCILIIDLFGGQDCHIITNRRSVAVSQQLTVQTFLNEKAILHGIWIFYCRRSHCDFIDLRFIGKSYFFSNKVRIISIFRDHNVHTFSVLLFKNVMSAKHFRKIPRAEVEMSAFVDSVFVLRACIRQNYRVLFRQFRTVFRACFTFVLSCIQILDETLQFQIALKNLPLSRLCICVWLASKAVMMIWFQ